MDLRRALALPALGGAPHLFDSGFGCDDRPEHLDRPPEALDS
jgi:hypothetical protein